jgi:hypothetical protein
MFGVVTLTIITSEKATVVKTKRTFSKSTLLEKQNTPMLTKRLNKSTPSRPVNLSYI